MDARGLSSATSRRLWDFHLRRLAEFLFWSCRPRVARVRRAPPPTLISQPQVDITLTLYFKVRVSGVSRGLPQAHPRVVPQPGGATYKVRGTRRGSTPELPGRDQGRGYWW